MLDILLIEDDSVLCKELKMFLEKWGYNVGDIKEFENILQEFVNMNPKLIIMDINLPFYDGFYWCKK